MTQSAIAAKMIDAINAVDPKLLDLFFGGTLIGIVSAVAWGLGYFGQPHILVRFMALTSAREAKAGRRIGITWMVLSCLGAAATALVGIAVYRHDSSQLPNPEGVFIALGQLLFHPLIAGFMLAAILAAIEKAAKAGLALLDGGRPIDRSDESALHALHPGLVARRIDPRIAQPHALRGALALGEFGGEVGGASREGLALLLARRRDDLGLVLLLALVLRHDDESFRG